MPWFTHYVGYNTVAKTGTASAVYSQAQSHHKTLLISTQKDSCLHELLETKQRKHSQHCYSSEDLYAKEEKFTHFRAICMQMFYADLLFKMQILNSAFLLQGKHKAIAERGNADDHSNTITLQDKIRGNAYGTAVLAQQWFLKSSSKQESLVALSTEGVKIHCPSYFSFWTYFPPH